MGTHYRLIGNTNITEDVAESFADFVLKAMLARGNQIKSPSLS